MIVQKLRISIVYTAVIFYVIKALCNLRSLYDYSKITF